MKFNELIKNEELLHALEDKGITNPTEIQEKVIPFILDGNDVLGQSQTGTGKTIAFSLPMLDKIESNNKLQSLILAPTRELAIQISRDIEELAKYTSIKTTAVYGSSSIEEQIRAISRGTEILVGTPGRVMDLIKRRVVKLTEIDFFILDEADEMLNMGFKEELDFIFNKVNNDRQVMLFSATMPKEILRIAQNYMSPEYKMVSVIADLQTAKNVTQEYYVVDNKTRVESLCRIVDFYNPKRCMIFCRTKRNADEVKEELSKKGYSLDIIHGDITQGQRIMTLDRFKAGLFSFLIATDVAARGIHVSDIDIVINYNLPESNEAYVHRIGRTGRVDKSGLAITLVTDNEKKLIKEIENHTKSNIILKELPVEQDIMKNRITDIVLKIDELKNSPISDSLFDEYLDSLTSSETRNVLNNLLLKELRKSIGSDFKVDTTVTVSQRKEKRTKLSSRDLKDSTRIFLTIGKLDRIEKRDFLCFLEKTAGIKEGLFSGIEILPKFTFVNINNKYLDVVLKKCNNITYNNRLIRVEKAKR